MTVHVPQDCVDLAGNVAFEATDDLSLGHSFAGATAHILSRWLVVAEAHENDAIECGIGPTITSSIEPMTVGLAG